MWNKLEDIVSSSFTILLKLVGFQYPLRTVLGLCLGGFIRGLLEIASSVFSETGIPSPEDMGDYWFFATGLVLIYSPLILEYMRPGRQEVFNESIERAFAVLRRTFKEGKISPAKRREFFLILAQATVERFNIDPDLEQKIKERNKQLEQLEQVDKP